MASGASRMRLRALKISKVSGGGGEACPPTPLGGAALRWLPTWYPVPNQTNTPSYTTANNPMLANCVAAYSFWSWFWKDRFNSQYFCGYTAYVFKLFEATGGVDHKPQPKWEQTAIMRFISLGWYLTPRLCNCRKLLANLKKWVVLLCLF